MLPIILVIHLTAMVLWMSGLLLVSSQLRYALKNGIAADVVKTVISPITKIFTIVGMVLALASGAIQFFIKGYEFYLRQGWFHAKVTLVLVLFVMTVIILEKVKQYSKDKRPSAKSLLVIHIISALSMLGIFIATSFKF